MNRAIIPRITFAIDMKENRLHLQMCEYSSLTFDRHAVSNTKQRNLAVATSCV